MQSIIIGKQFSKWENVAICETMCIYFLCGNCVSTFYMKFSIFSFLNKNWLKRWQAETVRKN